MQWKLKTKRTLSAAAFLAASIAAIVLFNVVIGAAADKIQLRWDLTESKLYALTNETKAVLSALDEEVTLYYFASAGHENDQIVQTLDMYRTASKYLKIVQSDPNTDPISARRFTDKGIAIQQNTIVLERGTRYRAILPSEIYQSYQTQSGQTLNAAFFGLEQLLTRGIAFVASDETKRVYFTYGHNEVDYTPVMGALKNENIETYQIDLKTQDIPEDADAVYIMAPSDDFTEDELLRLDAFLLKGKGAHVAFTSGKALPRLEEYLRSFWGVGMYQDLVCEADSSRTINYPYMFIPDAASHAITEGFMAGNEQLVCMHTRSMELSEVQEVTVQPLLTTTNAAFSVHGSDPSVQGYIREGQMPVAAALTRQIMDKAESRLVVSGSYKMYDSFFLSEGAIANRSFLYGITNYVVKNEDGVLSVSPKSLLMRTLMISDGLTKFYIAAICVLPALLCFAAGVYVWRRRRHL